MDNGNIDPTGLATPLKQSSPDFDSQEFIGSLCAFRPTQHNVTMKTTADDNATATWCEALIVNLDGSYKEVGEVPIFWEIVRRQLTDAKPWFGGTIVQVGRAYRINSPTEPEHRALQIAIGNHVRK